MAEVRVTLAAGNGRAVHSQASIGRFDDIFARDRLPEAGPAGAGFKLGIGAEERYVTADAAEETAIMEIPGAARIGPLGGGMTGDFKRSRGKLLLPLRFRLDDAGDGDFADLFTAC